jgi:hypothetical protein
MQALQRLVGNRAVQGLLRHPAGSRKGASPSLYRAAGAVAGRRDVGRLTVQRHGSPEHLMLGQVNPRDLRVIADARDGARIAAARGESPIVARQNALHVLIQERARVRAWQTREPKSVTDVVDPEWQVRLVRVVPTKPPAAEGARTETICTYGEMNMLADYFGSVEEMKAASPDTLWKVLQTEREDYYLTLGSLAGELASSMFIEKDVKGWWSSSKVKHYLPQEKLLKENPSPDDYTETVPVGLASQDFEGSSRFKNMGPLNKKLNDASMLGFEAVPSARGVLSEDQGLANFYGQGKSTGTAWGVTARNACHFAPESWRTWEHYHDQALSLAEQAHSMGSVGSSQDKTNEERALYQSKAAELENEAWVTNGFGDHYLQDSFASGHLVNKALVMQWFTKHLKTYNEVPGDPQRLSRMEQAAQPGMAPQNYSKNLGVMAQNPQAAANMSSSDQAWASLGLAPVNVSPMAQGVFAAWRVHPTGSGSSIQSTQVRSLDRSSLAAGAPFPTTDEEADAALAELAKSGLCEATEIGEGKDAVRVFHLHAVDLPSPAEQQRKSRPGQNDPGRAVQTATSNMYYEWLNNSLVQAGAGALHDHFCVQGLWVGCDAANELFKIYGDYAMLAAGGGKGAEFAAETSQMSQANVSAVLSSSRPVAVARAQGMKAIMDRFPDRVVPDFKPVDLASKAGLGKAIAVDEFNPPGKTPLHLDMWHKELESYMDGKYLATLFDTWAHSYVARMPGLDELTSFNKVSPHAGAEF